MNTAKPIDSEKVPGLSPAKQALLKIRELKQQLAEAQSITGEPIAIVSMACRFPKSSTSPEAFWESLVAQTDQVSDIPDDRWDLDAFHDDDPDVPGKMYARRGCFLDNVDLMDPEFFGISPREATWVDPQQRLLMECGWEALERAGWPTKKIAERTGVFIGWMHNDYQNEASDSFLNLNPYIATGAAGSFLCGRLAYYLGLQGPSVAVDTACSSSLVALHLAIQSLQRRDCDQALVGGVNAICSPTTNILTCKLQALSPTGQSRAFDAAADGYLRGEGCGVVTLKRLSDAENADDPILGVIRGSAIGHNGFSSGLTAPNPKAQEKVIGEALNRAGFSPDEVGYLEAHGTGTELGDPIELRAAAAALSGSRTKDNPLLVGSVKTNIGHLEAAAGMAGLIKVLLAMKHDRIPGQLNFETPNPHIPWDQIPVEVLTDVRDWPNPQRKIAGVSAFGMSGTNAHVVVEHYKKDADKDASPSDAQLPRLITLSAKNESALDDLADSCVDWLGKSETSLNDIEWTLGACRDHFEHRLAVVSTDHQDAAKKLEGLLRGGKVDHAFSGHARRKPKTAWQFTGQGSQYIDMASGLYKQYPVFKEAIDFCDQQVTELRGETTDVSLKQILFGDSEQINDTYWTQPAIFAVQMGLAKLFQSWNMQPNMVLGHSVGQYAAACVAEIMSWEDGIRLISERGRLIGSLPAGGKMLAVFAPATAAKELIAELPGLSLAAENGTHFVVSGPAADIDKAEKALADRNLRTKVLVTSHAFHSSLMDPILDEFASIADKIDFKPAAIPLVCNITGEVLPADQILDGRYWANHIRSGVRFAPSIDTLTDSNVELLLEIGPHTVLTRMAAANWKGKSTALVGSLKRDSDDMESLANCLGQLYVRGADIDFETALASRNDSPAPSRVLLPTYPFQRRRFWGPDKPRAAHAEFHTAHPMLGGEVSLAGSKDEQRFENFIETDSPAWLPDHEVMGNVVMPGAAWLEMAIATAEGNSIADATFEQPLQPAGRTAIQTVIKKSAESASRTMECYSRSGTAAWARHFSASLSDSNTERPDKLDLAGIESRCGNVGSAEDFYRHMQGMGLNYGSQFQVIQTIAFSETEVLTRLENQSDIRGYTVSPTLLDGALHSLAVGLLKEEADHLFLPVAVGKIDSFGSIAGEAVCHAIWKQNEGAMRTADITIAAQDGTVLLRLEDLRVQQVSLAAMRRMSGQGVDRLVYDISWQPMRLPAAIENKVNWIVVDPSDSAVGKGLSDRISSLEHKVEHVGGNGLQAAGDQNPWLKLFEQLSADDPTWTPQGITWIINQSDASIGPGSSTFQNCNGILNLFAALQQREIRGLECGIQILTTNGCDAGDVTIDPAQHQYWGLGRVLGAEQPQYRIRLIDIASPADDSEKQAQSIADVLLCETKDNQIAIRDGAYLVPRMKNTKLAKNADSVSVRDDASYLITGGLGKLGRQAAKWLSEKGAGEVVLVSRRQPNEETAAFLQQLNCKVTVHNANLGSREEMEGLFARFGNDVLPLAGVIHAAGVLDDGLIEQQTWERFEKVLTPKIVGSTLLDELTAELTLDFFVLYSSAASTLGSRGQSNYATANAFLDGLAHRRKSNGLPATSINWGPWTEGMADDQRIRKQLSMQGIAPLSVEDAHSVLEKLIVSPTTQATVIDVDWRRMPMGNANPMLSGLVPAKRSRSRGDSQLVLKLKQLKPSERRDSLLKTVSESLQRILSTPDAPATDRPLIEMGLDSLMAVEFGTELQEMLGDGFDVGPTMLFDHPSIDAITDHVLELVNETEQSAGANTDATASASSTDRKSVAREDVAIIGMACRFPGARNVKQFWQNLLDGVDSVCDIPSDRWDIERFYSEEPTPGKMYTRQGGFLDDIDQFDPAFFNISPQEACWIDPQHRMLLENSYLAMENAGIATSPLADPNVGVFMGIMGQDYAFLPTLDDEGVIEGFQGAGLSHSAGVGRISYVFGLEGPSVAVDTASSSSLVALIQAVRALQDGNCNMALAGGVNAILAPVNSLLMSKAGLLSSDGRCKSFSADASGFGRGEGCGVVVLKRLSDAQRDGDRIMAVVRGGAIVHNGTSSGITAPSGKAQSRVITEALRDAGVAPSQVQYLEAHGTGTEYGDPMELMAAAGVYGKGRKADQPLLVGSVKANISHLEAAGGVSGLIKTVLCLHHETIPPQAHFEQPSPHIPWKRVPVKMVAEQTQWPETDERLAGITALGLVGTNAHVILSGHDRPAQETEPEAAVPKRSKNLFLLSARTETSLKQLAENHQSWLTENPNACIDQVCGTLATGRKHHEHRLAITAGDTSDLKDRLSVFVSGKELDSIRAGHRKRSPKLVWRFLGRSEANLAGAQTLYRDESVFRDTIAKLDQRLGEQFPDYQPIAESFANGDWRDSTSDIQLFAFHAASARLWDSWGVQPDLVFGFDVGQYASACVAGSLCFFDAAVLVYQQSELLSKFDSVDTATEALDAFEKLADGFNFYPPNLPLVCSLSGSIMPIHKSPGGSYWKELAFAELDREATMAIADEFEKDTGLVFGSSEKFDDGQLSFPGPGDNWLDRAGCLHTLGVTFDFEAMFPVTNKVALPGTVFEKQRYWITEVQQYADSK